MDPVPTACARSDRGSPPACCAQLWTAHDSPPVELLVGRTDVFHGTNFVSPPTRRAREVVTVHDLTYELHAETVSDASLAYRELVPRALARGAHVVTPTAAVAAAVPTATALPAERVTRDPARASTRRGSTRSPSAHAGSPQRAAARALRRLRRLARPAQEPAPPPRRPTRALRARDPDAPGPRARRAGGSRGEPRDRARRAPDRVARPTPTLRSRSWRARARSVLPSIDEGFGLPALEALAAGRPVVAADIPVLREVGGRVRRFADPDDVDALADALLARRARPPDGPRTTARAARDGFTLGSRARVPTCDAYAAVTRRDDRRGGPADVTVVTVTYKGADLVSAVPRRRWRARSSATCGWTWSWSTTRSTDGTAELVARHHPDVRRRPPERNLGFAGGNNLALGTVSGRRTWSC